MAEKKNEYPPSVEADRRLLPFDTWEDYLDSLIEIADLRNLRSIASARTIAALGYRANGDTLTEKEFYTRRAVIHSIVYPTVRAYVQVSEGADVQDPFNRELAVRERANRVGILQSVIFIRHFTKGGFEISGYIDFAHRLVSEDWGPFFKSNKMLWPKDSDLGYYHWRHGTVRSNISRNYKGKSFMDPTTVEGVWRVCRGPIIVYRLKTLGCFFFATFRGALEREHGYISAPSPIMDPEKGLLFQNRHDHKIICPDPQQEPGQNTMKQRVYSPKYTQIEIYDHVVRRKS